MLNSPFVNRIKQLLLKGLKSFNGFILGLHSPSPSPCNVNSLRNQHKIKKPQLSVEAFKIFAHANQSISAMVLQQLSAFAVCFVIVFSFLTGR